MRSLGYQIWTVPIIFVFWPEKGLKLRESYQMISEGGVTETETSINSDDLSNLTPMVMNREP